MIQTAIQKQFVSNRYDNIAADEYFIEEAKRQIAIQLADKLPFKIEWSETPFGTEYTISLDVAIEDYKEFVKKYLQIQNENNGKN